MYVRIYLSWHFCVSSVCDTLLSLALYFCGIFPSVSGRDGSLLVSSLFGCDGSGVNSVVWCFCVWRCVRSLSFYSCMDLCGT